MKPNKLAAAGAILEASRGVMSKREAARRAGIAEARWRQIVRGVQRINGVDVPVSTKATTLARMAQAVGADVGVVLRTAGFDPAVANTTAPAEDPGSVAGRLRLIRDELNTLLAEVDSGAGRELVADGDRYGWAADTTAHD